MTILTERISSIYDIAKYICELLQSYIRSLNTYPKDPAYFIEKIEIGNLEPSDVLLKFIVIPLSTMIPVKKNFPEVSTVFCRHIFTLTYFEYGNQFHEHIDGITMENLVSFVIANCCMKAFKMTALCRATKILPYLIAT